MTQLQRLCWRLAFNFFVIIVRQNLLLASLFAGESISAVKFATGVDGAIDNATELMAILDKERDADIASRS